MLGSFTPSRDALTAKGLRFATKEGKAKPIANVECIGIIYIEPFMEELSLIIPLVFPLVSTRSWSRSPVNHRRESTEI